MQSKNFLLKTREYLRFSLFVFGYWLLVSSVHALKISEINFNPEGKDDNEEWVEIYNDTNNNIDLTSVTLEEDGASHDPVKAVKGDNLLAPGEYALILEAKSNRINSGYQGKMFTASFSLKNGNSTLVLRIKKGEVFHTVTYSPSGVGAIEGDTISVEGGSLLRSSPTPGLLNSILPSNNSTTTNQTSSTTTSASTSTTNQNTNTGNEIVNYFYRSYWPETEKIYIKPGENRIVMQGQEIVFDPKVLDGNKKEVKTGLLYKWNFGDGYTSDKREGLHAYKFVGEFVVNLQVNYNGFVDESKMYVKVVEPKVAVKIVSVDGVDVMEIKNENNFELNVGNLDLKNEHSKTYLLPDKLFVLGNKSILLGPELTGFASSTEKVTLSLLSGKVLSKFEHLKGAQVQSASTTSSSPALLLNNRVSSNLPRKIVVKKINPAPVVKPEVKEEIKKEIIPEPVQNSNRIEFKNEPTFSFFDQLKKIWGM